MMRHWIHAFRLRTLPLALSSIMMGNFLAAWSGYFSWVICLLTIVTTIFLQILSNLANDYGDSIHGADSDLRQGPYRMVQVGIITKGAMKRAMIIFSIFSLVSGLFLLMVSFSESWIVFFGFLTLGFLAIYASITYTVGDNPYGYAGLGDLFVFIFFGIVGVVGSYYLQTHTFEWKLLLPAMSCGLFATGVLNVNNIRDINSDQKAGKRSIPVRIGRLYAIWYHFFLLFSGWLATFIFLSFNIVSWSKFVVFLSLPFFLKNAAAVHRENEASALDPYLKQLAISTLLFVILFGLSLFL